MRLPRKISPCPIVEAVVELRFTANIPHDAVFGVLYNALREYYGKVEGLPILQLPEALRIKDPNLIYKPTHKLSNSNFALQVGPKVVTLSNINEYIGWNDFYVKILELFKIINKLQIINKSELLLLRYIDFFEKNIYDNLNLQISLSGSPLSSLSKNVNTEIQENSYIHTLRISDKAVIEMGTKKLTGSIIDITTQLNLNEIAFFNSCGNILNNIHKKQKELFFKLLKEEFILSLNPEY
jgi:uncharacterized protein (TIGR04255 family)